MKKSQTSKELIRDILVNGTPAEKRVLFAFTCKDSNEKILMKFKWYARSNFPRYFTSKDSPFHDKLIIDYIESYKGITSVLDAAFRDAAKTSYLKLFLAFAISCDEEVTHRYIKVLSKDYTNSVQIVTDVYNLLVETKEIFGDQFAKEGDKKREERMGSFTMKKGVKVSAGSVGQDQRGHLQDAYRPSWVLFEDIEDRGSIASQVQTQGIILKAQEAIDGMAKGGRFVVNCNYISEDGVVQWFMNKESVRVRITPIAKKVVYGVDHNHKKCVQSATMTWDRFTLQDINEKYKDAEDWFGEYMCDPGRSEDKFFDIDFIDEHIKNYAKEPIRNVGGINYFENYKPNHLYGQASDHSEGIGQDANTLVGFNFKTGELAYTHADNTIAPDLAAHMYAKVGNEFGNPIYAPETNNRCGGIVITTLKDIPYSNIYRWEVTDKHGNVLSKNLGWLTTGKSKTLAFMEFRTAFQDGDIVIYDINLLKEMRAYTNNDLQERTTGLITRHFDLLTAAVIAWQMKDHAVLGGNVKNFYKGLSTGKKKTAAAK